MRARAYRYTHDGGYTMNNVYNVFNGIQYNNGVNVYNVYNSYTVYDVCKERMLIQFNLISYLGLGKMRKATFPLSCLLYTSRCV